MFGKKRDKEKIQSEKGKYKFLISMLLAVAVTMGLITFEDYKLSDYETVAVLCVNERVGTLAKETVISEQNITDYFVKKEVNKQLVPKNVLTDTESLIGKKTTVELNANEILTGSEFSDVNEKLESIDNPVETSINASDLSQLVGGILREGDTIDISIVDEEGNITYEINGVYVTKAFNSSGELIDRNGNSVDGATSNDNAMIINVILSKDDELALNQQINSGKLRVAKTNDVVE